MNAAVSVDSLTRYSGRVRFDAARIDAEGATAPESLRQKDRWRVINSEKKLTQASVGSPKEQAAPRVAVP